MGNFSCSGGKDICRLAEKSEHLLGSLYIWLAEMWLSFGADQWRWWSACVNGGLRGQGLSHMSLAFKIHICSVLWTPDNITM